MCGVNKLDGRGHCQWPFSHGGRRVNEDFYHSDNDDDM